MVFERSVRLPVLAALALVSRVPAVEVVAGTHGYVYDCDPVLLQAGGRAAPEVVAQFDTITLYCLNVELARTAAAAMSPRLEPLGAWGRGTADQPIVDYVKAIRAQNSGTRILLAVTNDADAHPAFSTPKDPERVFTLIGPEYLRPFVGALVSYSQRLAERGAPIDGFDLSLAGWSTWRGDQRVLRERLSALLALLDERLGAGLVCLTVEPETVVPAAGAAPVAVWDWAQVRAHADYVRVASCEGGLTDGEPPEGWERLRHVGDAGRRWSALGGALRDGGLPPEKIVLVCGDADRDGWHDLNVPEEPSGTVPARWAFCRDAGYGLGFWFVGHASMSFSALRLRLSGGSAADQPALDGAKMVLIPAGIFTMGSSDEVGTADERPKRVVYLDAYRIHEHEVTVAQYRRFCEATGRAMPPEPPWGWHDEHPIVNVSWFDAAAYAEYYGMELPTEAQWEKAARGDSDERLYSWLGDWARNLANGRGTGGLDKWEQVAPVGSFPEGASPYGVMDMCGNVWEWCRDWYRADWYGKMPDRNPLNETPSEHRVTRGGAWDCEPAYLRVTNRDRDFPDKRYDNVGFRCVAAP